MYVARKGIISVKFVTSILNSFFRFGSVTVFGIAFLLYNMTEIVSKISFDITKGIMCETFVIKC